MRVLVISPIRLFGDGVVACLKGEQSIDAVESCYRADSVAESVASFSPDVVLVDVAQQDGLREGRALAASCPDIPIVALASGKGAEDVIACADAGFTSYVPRDAPVSQLRAIIDMALRGEVPCDPKVSGGLLRELRMRNRQTASEQASEPLTRRECDVLKLLTRGLSNKEIARHLGLSEATVKNHVHEILAKLHVRRRAQAMARVRDEPWLAKIG